jgi:hypothetical protein
LQQHHAQLAAARLQGERNIIDVANLVVGADGESGITNTLSKITDAVEFVATLRKFEKTAGKFGNIGIILARSYAHAIEVALKVEPEFQQALTTPQEKKQISWRLNQTELDGVFPTKFMDVKYIKNEGNTLYNAPGTPENVTHLKSKGFTIVTDRNLMAPGRAFLEVQDTSHLNDSLNTVYAYKYDLETKLGAINVSPSISRGGGSA